MGFLCGFLVWVSCAGFLCGFPVEGVCEGSEVTENLKYRLDADAQYRMKEHKWSGRVVKTVQKPDHVPHNLPT